MRQVSGNFPTAVYPFYNENFHGNVIYQEESFPVNGGTILRSWPKRSALRSTVSIVFLQRNSRSNFETSTNESPIVSGEETFVDRLQFFRDARRRRCVSTAIDAIDAAFLRLLTNGFLSFWVGKTSGTIDQRACLMDSES